MTPSGRHAGRRRAAVYRRGQTYVVTAARQFGYGTSYRAPPYAVVKRSAADDEIGEAVVSAVARFECLVRAPSVTEIDGWNGELYAAVGVKDEAAFERSASLVQIVERAGLWVVEPQDRRRGYWSPRHEQTFLHLTRRSPGVVGAAVRRAFGS
jgi:hypothetical protein